jgi:very-short-patch-repair endonuclease
MDRHLEDAIAERARGQHGVVTRAQLLQIGLRSGAIRRLVAGGRFRRLHSGVYLAGPLLPPRARELAAALACGPGAVVSHRSAAALWGLIAADETAPIDVSVLRTGRCRPCIRVHRVRALDPVDRTRLARTPITTAPRTLIDLAAVANPHELGQAVARAEREGLIDRAKLFARASGCHGRRGIATLRAILDSAAELPFVRSEAEARFLRLLRDAGLPTPRTNNRVHGFELDCYWPDHATAVEVDGYRYHRTRDSFEHDRRRTAILAARGIRVIPVTWRQIVEEPVATAVRIAQALLHAAAYDRGRGPASETGSAPDTG